MPEHTCRATGCDLDADTFMCPDHMSMLPPAFRQSIEATDDPRTCNTTVAKAAIDHVAHAESRRPGRARSRKKPVQLALFDL